MPLPRATNYRSAGLSQPAANQYIGNAFVYVLASRIDPNLCKIGKGNPTTRCDHWNSNSPHGGMLNNNLSVFAAYEFDTEAEALEYESQAHAIYNFVNLNPNAAGGEQEFFAVPPQQATATLDILHGQYAQAADTSRLIAEARQDGYNSAPLVIAQREAAERAQREAAERAQREAAERVAQEAVERTNRGLREAAERAQREAAERAQREAVEAAQREAAERESLRKDLGKKLDIEISKSKSIWNMKSDRKLLRDFAKENKTAFPSYLLPGDAENLGQYKSRLMRSQNPWLTF
jgi:hypothetical protein